MAREKTTKERVSLIHSIQTKIIAVSDFLVLATILINLIIVIPMVTESTETSLQRSLQTATQAARVAVNSAANLNGGGVTPEQFKEAVGHIKVQGLDSSYTYVVDVATDLMLYHPTESKIGSAVENAVVKEVNQKLRDGQQVQAAVVPYDFNGTIKYASYSTAADDKFLVVVSADYDEAFAETKAIQRKLLEVALVILMVAVVIAFLVSKSISRPIKKLTYEILKVADFDFTVSESLLRLEKHKDEVGRMGRAIETMRSSMQKVLEQITGISSDIDESAMELKQLTERANTNSSDNSATAQELAASMEETSATAEVIDGNAAQINDTTKKIVEMTESGRKLSETVMKRASELKISTEETNRKTEKIFSDISVQTEEAIEKAKAVEKIQYLANAIRDIASQTELLSLNASIEAARAGDAGRGFAVVASEIGTLANQSTQTVDNISSIVEEVETATNSMAECLKQTLSFMDVNIRADYTHFIDVSNQYNDDANSFGESMGAINASIEEMNEALDTITVSINDISTTITEAATGVSDIAEKTMDIADGAAHMTEKAEESYGYAKDLKNIANQFKL